MPSFTVQKIVDRAADQADMHDGFVHASTWLDWFNFERKALAITLARGALLRDLTFTTIAPGSADNYTFAFETLAIVGVWEIKSDQHLRPLRIVNFLDNFFQQAGGPIRGAAESVSVEELTTGFKLRFFPADTSGTYLLVTAGAPTDATALTDTFILPMGIEEKLVLELAKRALIKEESDISDVARLIQGVDQKVEEYIWGRTFAQVPSVRNVDSVQRKWGGLSDFVIPLPDVWVWL
jgi:hypothetical protein